MKTMRLRDQESINVLTSVLYLHESKVTGVNHRRADGSIRLQRWNQPKPAFSLSSWKRNVSL